MTRHDERKEKQFWIDPTGEIFKYTKPLEDTEDIVSMHYEIAHKLFPNVASPDDYLIALGWIMVGSSVYNCPIIHRKPKQAQLDVLHDLDLYDKLCFLYKNSYPLYSVFGHVLE